MPMYAFKSGTLRGVVSATNMVDLFWSIDEYLNPFECQIRRIPEISMCWNIGVDEVPETDNIDDDVDYERTEFEVGDRTTAEVEWRRDKWRKINWRKYLRGDE